MSDESNKLLLETFKIRFPFDIQIIIRNTKDGIISDDTVLAHRIVLSSSSSFFRCLLESSESPSPVLVDLSLLPNSLNSFNVMLAAIYTGEVTYTIANPLEVLSVCRACRVVSIESKVISYLIEMASNGVNHINLLNTNPVKNYLHALMSFYLQPGLLQPYLGAGVPLSLPFNQSNITDDDNTKDDDNKKSVDNQSELSSSPRSVSSDNEKIVPSDDKEGWCRNKKYIEKVDGGFMCIVCRKIYGRYNSVSYHVTIYHRNPPIRCDEKGCQFSTREARYIHFHKYYRHHIPLPESIDLGSRKCPLCRHVSKSPAMLEKHISRHLPNNKEKSLDTFNCDNCIYRGKTPSLLARHKQFAHSESALPSPLFKCTICSFSTICHHSYLLHTSSHSFQPNIPIDLSIKSIL